MSASREITLECPSCKVSQTMTVYGSINATQNPELRAELLEGKINIFQCKQCDGKSFVDTNFIYHDMRQELLVMYQPWRAVEEEQFLLQFDRKGNMKIPKGFDKPPDKGAYTLNPHIVFGMDELVRFIMFRELLHAQETELH
ncbi:MAG: CpXC domain-containing protein [Candidatus Eisenbacteria bacterium]|uniref:CpXC domain-containing protein n=1 Tax=Eiseniibacteriota bacterium TaxID=2212470 RepID=A0A948RVF3_UNCEI|nr:CpXC domain-containing protein [Candidatus Eisenbacteria bacterium]MBU2691743.1 CpXC domain-containing protein [Candidatus Eisenbacteria bacterium]